MMAPFGQSMRTLAGVVLVPGVTTIADGAGADTHELGGLLSEENAPEGLIRNAISEDVRFVVAKPATSNTRPLMPAVVLIKFEKSSVFAVAPDFASTFAVSNAAFTLVPANEDPR